jgi:preprotein translocase SecE subunit
VARNDDRARARRAKRRGENPSDAENAPEEVDASTPAADDEIVDAVIVNGPDSGIDPDQDFTSEPGKKDDGEMSSLEAEVLTHQELTGSAVGFGQIETEADAEASRFEPNAGGLVLGGEVSTGGGPRLIRFFRASWAELQRVRWPNRQQVAQGTAVTLGFVVIAGAYLGVADYIARQLVNLIL